MLILKENDIVWYNWMHWRRYVHFCYSYHFCLSAYLLFYWAFAVNAFLDRIHPFFAVFFTNPSYYHSQPPTCFIICTVTVLPPPPTLWARPVLVLSSCLFPHRFLIWLTISYIWLTPVALTGCPLAF